MPDQAKTEKILSYPVPVDVARVRQFLGLASYYRHFVPGFAKAAVPLHALLKMRIFIGQNSAKSHFTISKSCLLLHLF